MRKEISVYWTIGALVFLAGVFLVDNFTVAPGISTTPPQVSTAFIIGIKITNRIYNDSLKDPQSMDYKILRSEVENVFNTTYSNTSVEFQRIADMTFSNGSVIAISTAVFRTTQINEQIVKNVFVDNYISHPSMVLDLNISYTYDQEPTAAILPLEMITTTPSHSIITTNATDSTTISRETQNTNGNTATHTTPTTTSNLTHATNTTITTHTSPTRHTSTDPVSHRDSTTHTVSGHTTPDSSNTANKRNHTTPHFPLSNSTFQSFNDSTAHNSTASPAFGNNTTSHLMNTSNVPSSNHSQSSPGGDATLKPVGPGGSGTTHSSRPNPESTATGTAREQGVPSWGIALLALAAIILFLLLLLFILLLLCWCCWWRRRGFMNVTEPDPPGYYNPEIPLYSTHSTYDSQNGKSPDSDSEKPQKNRTGMYVVNQ